MRQLEGTASEIAASVASLDAAEGLPAVGVHRGTGSHVDLSAAQAWIDGERSAPPPPGVTTTAAAVLPIVVERLCSPAFIFLRPLDSDEHAAMQGHLDELMGL